MFRDAQIFIPSCVYSPSGLGEFSADGRLFLEPRVGDVAFFSFPTISSSAFSMPHVGIVVDTDGWKNSRTYETVEGQVSDSVRRVTRDSMCLIGFGRPKFDVRPGRGLKQQTGSDLVIVDPARVSLSSVGRDVLNVQLALARMGLLDRYSPGTFDAATRLAFAHWQRLSGHVGRDADGIPTPASVTGLGVISGVFSVQR